MTLVYALPAVRTISADFFTASATHTAAMPQRLTYFTSITSI